MHLVGFYYKNISPYISTECQINPIRHYLPVSMNMIRISHSNSLYPNWMLTFASSHRDLYFGRFHVECISVQYPQSESNIKYMIYILCTECLGIMIMVLWRYGVTICRVNEVVRSPVQSHPIKRSSGRHFLFLSTFHV